MDSITLESVEAAFCEWRAQRSSRIDPIPEDLWGMALRLYPEYKRSKICHRLRLSSSQFKPRLESRDRPPSNKGFVLALRDEVNVNLQPSPEVQLTIQGKERVLTLCVNVHALAQILPHVGVLL